MASSAERLVQALSRQIYTPLVAEEQEAVFFGMLVERVINSLPMLVALPLANPTKRASLESLKAWDTLTRERIQGALATFAAWLPAELAQSITAICVEQIQLIASGAPEQAEDAAPEPASDSIHDPTPEAKPKPKKSK